MRCWPDFSKIRPDIKNQAVNLQNHRIPHGATGFVFCCCVCSGLFRGNFTRFTGSGCEKKSLVTRPAGTASAAILPLRGFCTRPGSSSPLADHCQPTLTSRLLPAMPRFYLPGRVEAGKNDGGALPVPVGFTRLCEFPGKKAQCPAAMSIR